MNLKYMKVSIFEITFKKKIIFYDILIYWDAPVVEECEYLSTVSAQEVVSVLTCDRWHYERGVAREQAERWAYPLWPYGRETQSGTSALEFNKGMNAVKT